MGSTGPRPRSTPLRCGPLTRRTRPSASRLIPADHEGPRPSGGVGGTRIGVKCLHAHYANHLVGADDPVGAWVEERLRAEGRAFDPSEPAR